MNGADWADQATSIGDLGLTSHPNDGTFKVNRLTRGRTGASFLFSLELTIFRQLLSCIALTRSNLCPCWTQTHNLSVAGWSSTLSATVPTGRASPLGWILKVLSEVVICFETGVSYQAIIMVYSTKICWPLLFITCALPHMYRLGTVFINLLWRCLMCAEFAFSFF